MKKEEEEGVGKKVDIASLFKHAFSGWCERRKGGKTFFSTFYAPAEPWGRAPLEKVVFDLLCSITLLWRAVPTLCVRMYSSSRSRRSLNRSAALTPPPFSYSLCTWT